MTGAIERNDADSLAEPIELTILLPCLNEAETLAVCIEKARRFLVEHGVCGEVLVADNGSSDGSQLIAARGGARVVHIPTRGYGAALLGGIEQARGRYVIMADSDDSYDLEHLLPFVEKLRAGWQLVMGNRFKGGIAPGAMPPLHRYLGNPVLSGLGRLFFNSTVGDFHSGLRGFDREAIRALSLRTTGMEFASEMVVKATLRGLRITEVPIILSPDGRSRPPHLDSWRDGWRHLRFLLLYSPTWLFQVPGALLAAIGGLGMAILLVGPLQIGGVSFDINTLMLSALLFLTGLQILIVSRLARRFAIVSGLLPAPEQQSRLREHYSLETLLLLAVALILGGTLVIGAVAIHWAAVGFGHLNPRDSIRVVIPAATLVVGGIQIMVGAFFRSLLMLPHR